MNLLDEQTISCPYCGEFFTVLVDCSAGEQSYIEDCQVCCQPMVLDIYIDEDDQVSVTPRREDD